MFQALDKACDRVCGHITLNQRLTYKRFKQKLVRAKITYSKIKGDKEMERDLRKKNMTFTYNTNYGQDPEDEEVLQKIWNTYPARKGLKSAPAGTSSNRPVSTVTIARPVVPPRPETVAGGGNLPNISDLGKGKLLTTGLQAPVDLATARTDEEDSPRKDPRISPVPSPDKILLKRRQSLKSAPAGQKSTSATARTATTPNIFEEDKRPTLLEIQRERVKAADYDNRVQQLCNAMKPFRVDADHVIHDYYFVVVDSRCKEIERKSSYRRRESVVTQEDIEKATGKLHIPSMTMKKLNWDFTRDDPEPEPAVMQHMRGAPRQMPMAAW